MKKALLIFLSVLGVFFVSPSFAHHGEPHEGETTEEIVDEETGEVAHGDHDHEAGVEEHGLPHTPHILAVIPFVLLLLMIATGPLFFEHFWHKNYPLVAIGLGLGVVLYYAFGINLGTDSIIHSLAEYVQFIALLAGLFMAAGGILINVDKEGKPWVNVVMLIIGACLANVIGTTGASMLLIRPFIKLNKDRVKPYHIIFFIFMVSNVGGALTPIGDPPLFLGFLKGVPFAWTITHDVVPWAFAIGLLAAIFLVMDSRNTSDAKPSVQYTGKISIKGGTNFLFIAVIIAAVFVDPNVFSWVPAIELNLHHEIVKISFIREIVMLGVGFLSFKFANKEALKGNEFDFEPIKEVAFIFIGIFFTMMPALQLVSEFAKSDAGVAMINTDSLYWLTGALSGVLDNAPTYLNFFAAAFAADATNAGAAVTMNPANAAAYAEGTGAFAVLNGQSIVHLTAISCASVFFGAMTYIGNAPNFMVKAIAEQSGVTMPSFVSYVVRYSVPILLPVLLIVWLVFFYFDLISMIVL
jgi:Na+/H+ antiporter NhaD/arsenite permease-like protein